MGKNTLYELIDQNPQDGSAYPQKDLLTLRARGLIDFATDAYGGALELIGGWFHSTEMIKVPSLITMGDTKEDTDVYNFNEVRFVNWKRDEYIFGAGEVRRFDFFYGIPLEKARKELKSKLKYPQTTLNLDLGQEVCQVIPTVPCRNWVYVLRVEKLNGEGVIDL